MAETKVFKLLNNVTTDMLGEEVECFLRDSKGMITQSAKTAEGYIIQGKQDSDMWKKISGIEQAITVQIFNSGDIINVTAGFGKWSDKIGAGFIGTFIYAPLAITAAIGAYMQKKLPAEIFDFIEKFILSGGQSVSVSLSGGKRIPADAVICKSCKSTNSKDSKFCSNCGEKLFAECKNCGAVLYEDTKFCPECGQNLHE